MRPPDFPDFWPFLPISFPTTTTAPHLARASFRGAKTEENLETFPIVFLFRGFFLAGARFFLTVPHKTKQGEEAQGQSRVWGGCAVSEWRSAGRSVASEGRGIDPLQLHFFLSIDLAPEPDTTR